MEGVFMIVVTGATGQLGRLVIAALIKKVPASGIVAAVRNVEKAEDIAAVGVQVRYADYNNLRRGRSSKILKRRWSSSGR